MTDETLMRLAEAAGVAAQWEDAAGNPKTVEPDVLRHVLGALGLPAQNDREAKESLATLKREQQTCPPLVTATVGQPVRIPGSHAGDSGFELRVESGKKATGTARRGADGTLELPAIDEPGYHQLTLGDLTLTVAVAPARCVSVDDMAGAPGARPWGLAAQLYSLRRQPEPNRPHVGGMGDFTALAELARRAAARGADALAISPVHAMFSADTRRYSPYAPSSRLFLNVLYADPLDVFSPQAVSQALRRLQLGPKLLELEKQDLIDWPEVGRHRLALLRDLFIGFPGNASPDAQKTFRKFREEAGNALEQHAIFEALHAAHLPGGAPGWQQWPEGLRSPDSREVEVFAASNTQEIRFHAFLQWLADRGLAGAQKAARDAGMRIGLVGDLAVGTDPGGSHAWSRQAEIITGLSPGAPPDTYNPNGQAWGLTAFAPRALRQRGFRAFIEMLRASLAHAGGLRVDHALGLARMWLVPEGSDPKEGAYVTYPFDDMVRLIALESARHNAIIMAENLGTVPADFNDRIESAGMMGMSVLWFERTDDDPPGFRAPQDWSRANMATTSTHDLPTVAGWWQQRDLDWRTKLDLLGPVPEDEQREQRVQDRDALWKAVKPADAPDGTPDEAPLEDIVRYVGRSAAPLVLVPLEDVLGNEEQPNLPGTIDEHPNWQRRLVPPVQDMLDAEQPARTLSTLINARKSS